MPKPAELEGVWLSREKVREWIAIGAIAGFFIIILVIVIWGWLGSNKSVDETLKVLTTTAGLLSGIVGAIIGFYFRGESGGD